MTNILINTPSRAIPLYNNLFGFRPEQKIHPDILFEMNMDFNSFSKTLIENIRSKYPGTGINPKKKNSFSLGCSDIDNNNYFEKKFLESILILKPFTYVDYDMSKNFVAFDTENMSQFDIIFVSENIRKITNKNVYLNLPNKKYDNFEKIISYYASFDLFFSDEELIYYLRSVYIDNIKDLLYYLIEYTSNNNENDDMEF